MIKAKDKKVNEPIRILVVDDNQDIHADFNSVFEPEVDTRALDGLTSEILGKPSGEDAAERAKIQVQITSAYQGEESLGCVKEALAQRKPFEVAFVDMRMPPGWDGLETIRRLWAVDPALQVVICTAYSDHDWSEIRQTLGESDSLLVLKKPFDSIEVIQMSQALSTKWRAARALEQQNAELTETVKQLYNQIQKRENAEQELIRQVNTDTLTSLPNRLSVTNQVEQFICRAKRDAGYGFALSFMDLDQFKYINDSLGHNIGDMLLVKVGQRLREMCTQLNDTLPIGEVMAGRIGGDEFVVLFGGVTQNEYVEESVRRIQAELSRPCNLGGHEIAVNSSYGIVMCSADYDDVGLVLRDADTALYAAKEGGRDRHVFFDESMHANVSRRTQLERELRHALERDQISLNYQPIIDLESGKISGFEALMRWNHPELGQVSPVEFLPVAEDCGLVVDLGEWALRRACIQYREWVDGCPRAGDFIMHVNVSPRQFAVADFTERVGAIIRETGVEPGRIGLEVTETAIMSDRDRILGQIQELSDAGHPMAMDDFGTGHSSLGQLHDMPFSVIKIDRSFIQQIDTHGRYINTIKAIVEMSHNRNMTVVAEGIETLDQLVQLQAVECNHGQGYLFSPAITASKAESLIRLPQLWAKIIEESLKASGEPGAEAA